MLRSIYEDATLRIDFDEETFRFSIVELERDPFDFNTASDGFSAVLDIVVGLMLRMTRGNTGSLKYDAPGIALIDEVENHLHLSLQKRIVPFLTDLFTNVQFVISTHSPFVLTSAEDAVLFDLENHSFVERGLSDNTYSSVVESYFNVDELSSELREKYDRHMHLAEQCGYSENDLIEIAELELYLDEIPDYLDLGITTEYKKAKLRVHAKGLTDD